MHPCRYPACPILLKRSGYCEQHQASAHKVKLHLTKLARHNDPALSEAIRIRSSSRWNKVRRLKLNAYPICEDPFRDHANKQTTEDAKQVHHIKGLRHYPELAFDWDNLMSVCYRCHSRLEREEQSKEEDEVRLTDDNDSNNNSSNGFKYF